MKKLITISIAVLAALTLSAQNQSRRVISFDNNWRFSLGDIEKASEVRFNDASWRTLNLPHDWSIEGENLRENPGGGSIGYFPMGTGWYRKTFNIPGYNKNKEYTIEFDGVYMNSTVWVNGKCLGTRPYGYSSFSYDLTPVLKASGNVIAVRVDNSKQPNSRWYSGSGIYRHVRIVETGKTHFEKWGIFNYTESISDCSAVVNVEATVVNDQTKAVSAVIRHEVIDKNGAVVASSDSEVEMPAGQSTVSKTKLVVLNPVLWDLENPELYTLRSSIVASNKQLDVVDNVLGIRTIEYPLDKGFLLNGKQVKMKGVNVHHDGGAVGAAVPERVWERRIEILKEGGCNAIRTSHNAPAPEFLDLCDRLGMLVMDEAFDQWESGKNEFDYHVEFAEWHTRDLTAMVARDRNHPSVVMWSVGNEIRDHRNAKGPGIAADLIATCHRLDPTRLVTEGNDQIASNDPASPEFLAAFANDIEGYNYPDRWRERRELMYAVDKAEFPERRVVATESSGLGGTRGRAFRPSVDVEQRWRFTLAYDYVIGDFMWTGIDYYGESFWPTRGSTSGYLDNCGFKKDGYWFFKSIWTDDPMVHIAGNWTMPGSEGKIVQVVCFSNCESAELFVNGKSYGRKSIEVPRKGVDKSWNSYGEGKHFGTTADLHLTWDVEYQPGEIKIVGTSKGKTVEETVRTAGVPAKLRATVDRDSFKADPSDVAHITVEVLDAEGNLCPSSDNLVKFSVKGARLIGVENGNMADLGSVKASERKAFAGMCLAIVGADKPGKVSVTVTADGLQSDSVVFEAK